MIKKPEYHPRNPKLNFFDKTGRYVFSSNWYTSVSHAEDFYPEYSIEVDRGSHA